MKYRTPLRYPGGKQKLWPFIAEVIEENGLLGCSYFEPYAGGAGVALELLFSGKVSSIYINDSSRGIFAFWQSVMNHPEELCRRISRASLTVSEWRRQRDIVRGKLEASLLDLGFATFYLNRCNRSGIISGGLIGGLDQKGKWLMDARFPRNELIMRIQSLASKSDRIFVTNSDAEDYIANFVPTIAGPKFVYCDPPYFRKAERLYPNFYTHDDHARLARRLQTTSNLNWVVSYDSCEQIRELYEKSRSFEYSLQYNAGNAYKGREIFVASARISLPSRSSVSFIDSALTVAA